MIWYIDFYGFSFFLNFDSKSKIVSLRFIKKHQFVANIDGKAVFFGRECHIPDWLYIKVWYLCFYGFSFFLNFGSKSKVVSLQFYRKTPVCDKH
jgi:hypothetical protein